MSSARRMTPILVAVLVVQTLAAVLPHLHHPPAAPGGALRAPSAQGTDHDCFACSVHVPVVASADAERLTPVETSTPGGWTAHGPEFPVRVASGVGPRGPPSV